MTNSKSSINLFRSRKKGVFDDFMKWALTVGRLVVILTEAVALSAFIYRFSLDRQLIDLNDQIVQKQAIVKLFTTNEILYRNLQDRLQESSNLTKTTKNTVALFDAIANINDQNIIITNIFFSQNQIKIDANVQSVSALTNFVNSLKANPAIASVSLDKIENKITSAIIVVSITATTKQKVKIVTTQ